MLTQQGGTREGCREAGELLAAVQSQAAELDATIAAVADGLIIYNLQGEVLRMNDAAAQMLHYEPGALHKTVAQQLVDLHIQTPDGRPLAAGDSPPERALRGETVRGVVAVLRPTDGRELWVSSSAAPVRGADGKVLGAVITFTDITALHDLQEQRADTLRMVSHDLRNPLTVVETRGELLWRELDQGRPGEARYSAQAILDSAQRMDAMIQELIEVNRLEASQAQVTLRPLALRPLIEQLLARLSTSLETARVRLKLPSQPLQVLADPGALERILTNLISNALKYSPADYEVTVSAHRRGDEVITSVRDQGAGIAPEDLPRLFQRYGRTATSRRRVDSLGLGLYITRRLVESLGGAIWVESRPGEGSTFSFSLRSAPLEEGITRPPVP